MVAKTNPMLLGLGIGAIIYGIATASGDQTTQLLGIFIIIVSLISLFGK
ncbi:MAG: hypothetical protein KAT91_02220 [Candidatus Aenigmarchaeota archaeon]|nr:hypothetical protein [Candidatus Aenigmarchaeota archaeon]